MTRSPTAVEAPSHAPSYAWTAGVALLLALTVAGPLVFGLPVLGTSGAADANFNLQIVQGYMRSLAAGHLFPRWLADGNSGLGSPVFYFYGRLPFLLAAGLAMVCHVGAVAGLLLGLGAVRLLAFFTCRAWLRRYGSAEAADCGALTFLAIPFAMTLNTIGRVGFAEATATALIPLLFLLQERETGSWRARARQVAWLGLVYAALAATHLPQTLLAFGVAALYALLLRGWVGVAAQAAGAACGLLLSGASVLPAVRMQRWITPFGWRGDPFLDIRNNFLFTLSRYRIFHLIAQECYLYSSWLLCAGILLAFAFGARRSFGLEQGRRPRAVFVALLVCLLAMTKVSWPLWVDIPPLRTLQFPWRLFPETVALSGGLVALLVGGTRRRQGVCLGLLGLLVAGQLAVPAAGAFVWLSGSPLARRVPEVVVYRLPIYAPWPAREMLAFEGMRSFPPEYIPADAHAAGWHVSEDQQMLVPGEQGRAVPSALPASLAESQSGDGDLLLRGSLAAPGSLLLPSFFFPDERLTGTPGAAIALDGATGLTRIKLPAGAVLVRIDHRGATPSVRLGRVASGVGALVLLLLFGVSLRRGAGVDAVRGAERAGS